MEAWEKWWRMAQGSLTAAQFLETQKLPRSSASRAYYAAYQAATALLLYGGQMPPEGREAWSHEATPDLLGNLSGALLSPSVQKDLGKRLADLYQIRLGADYRGDENIEDSVLRAAVRSASFIVRTIRNIVPGA